MKTAYCLQHVDFEGPGVFEQALRKASFNVERVLVPSAGLPASPGDFLLVMGGPMSANDPDAWIADELAFIRNAVHAGVPFLGICLGSQLLAKALGGSVYKGPRIELGLSRIERTPEGQSDPLFADAPNPLNVIEWHGEGIRLPPGAVCLASSPSFPVQAFRYGKKAVGLLFHAELEEAGLGTLCNQCPDDVKKVGLTREAVLETAHPRLPGLNQWAESIIEYLAAQ